MNTTNQTPNALNADEAELFRTYMEKAAFSPEELISEVDKMKNPPYWAVFWKLFAGIKISDEAVLDELSSRIDETEELDDKNLTLILSYGEYLEYCDEPEDRSGLDWAIEYLDMADGQFNPLLQECADSLRSLLTQSSAKPAKKNFYTDQLFITK